MNFSSSHEVFRWAPRLPSFALLLCGLAVLGMAGAPTPALAVICTNGASASAGVDGDATNTACGQGVNTTGGTENVAIGNNAAINPTGPQSSNAVSIGAGATNILSASAANESVAIGSTTAATAALSTALAGTTAFNQSVAIGAAALAGSNFGTTNGVAIGTLSFADGQNATALGADTRATGGGSVAVGAFTSASGPNSTAIGSNSVATAFSSFAAGNNATASGGASTAIGQSSVASAANSTAIGTSAHAFGSSSIVIGNTSTATAAGINSIAIGNGNNVAQANSVAIGNGVTTSRPNQVAVGTTANTYTLAGVTSAASLAAQTGPVSFVTSDASGNLATSTFNPGNVSALQSQVGALQSQVASIQNQVFDNRLEARTGTAVALAAGSMPSLLPGRKFAVSAGYGNFEGANAFGFGATALIYEGKSYAVVGNVGGAFGLERTLAGGRGAVSLQW